MKFKTTRKEIFDSRKSWKEKEEEIDKLLQKFCELNK